MLPSSSSSSLSASRKSNVVINHPEKKTTPKSTNTHSSASVDDEPVDFGMTKYEDTDSSSDPQTKPGSNVLGPPPTSVQDTDSNSGYISEEDKQEPADASHNQVSQARHARPTIAFRLPTACEVAVGVFAVGAIAALIYAVVGFAGVNTDVVINYDDQAHTRMTNWVKDCLDASGITNIDPSQLASDILAWMNKNYTNAPVAKTFATTPGWEGQVQCPDGSVYIRADEEVLTRIFVDLLNNVIENSSAAIRQSPQTLLMLTLALADFLLQG